MDPWIFAGEQSVRWIIEHPLPIFLCIVDKAEARILVYLTTPRFAAWILPFHKDRLELVPGTATRAQPIVTSWEQGSSFELNAPILDFTIQQALDDSFRAQIAATLKFWINNDMENIFRIKCGIHHFQVPYEYETNSVEGKGGTIELGGPFTEKSFERAKTVLKELLRHVTKHLHDKSDLVSAAVYATALLRLSLTYQLGEFTPHYSRLHTDLNQRFGIREGTYAYQAVYSLLRMITDKLAEHGIRDPE